MSRKINLVLFVVMSFQLHVFSGGEITFNMWDSIRKKKLIEQYSLDEQLSIYSSIISREVLRIERSLGSRVKLKKLPDFSLPDTKEQCESILFYSSRYEDAYLVYLISGICKFKELRETAAAAVVSRSMARISKKPLPPFFTLNGHNLVYEVRHLFKNGPKISSGILRFSRGGVDFTLAVTSATSRKRSKIIQVRTEHLAQLEARREAQARGETLIFTKKDFVYDFANMSTIGHCVNILADLRGTFKPLTVKYTSSRANRNLDPLGTFMQLDRAFTDKGVAGHLTYLGDINPQGEILKSGYLRDLYREGMKGQTFILSSEYMGQILDLTRIYGKTVIMDNHFFGVADLKQAMAIQYGEDKGFEDAKKKLTSLIKTLSSRIARPDKKSILSQLAGILKKYPNYLSAKALQRVVLGKLPIKISYQSSYIEASYYRDW